MYKTRSSLNYKTSFSCSYDISNNILSENEIDTIYGDFKKFVGEISIKVSIVADIDESFGMIYNHKSLKSKVDFLSSYLDNKVLHEDIEFFTNNIPTLENIARFCWNWLNNNSEYKIDNLRCVTLKNSDGFSVRYQEITDGLNDVAGFIV
jgi:hypothetical protein